MRYKHQDLTKAIIEAFYKVFNRLGYGFPERVYENSMVIELEIMGLRVKQQLPIEVRYRGQNARFLTTIENQICKQWRISKNNKSICVHQCLSVSHFKKTAKIVSNILIADNRFGY